MAQLGIKAVFAPENVGVTDPRIEMTIVCEQAAEDFKSHKGPGGYAASDVMCEMANAITEWYVNQFAFEDDRAFVCIDVKAL